VVENIHEQVQIMKQSIVLTRIRILQSVLHTRETESETLGVFEKDFVEDKKHLLADNGPRMVQHGHQVSTEVSGQIRREDM